MVELIVYEYYREAIKNFFICLFVAAICLLTTVTYSFLNYEYSKYKLFKSFVNKDGYMTYTTRSLDNELEDIEKIYSINYATLYTNGNMVKTYVYDRDIWGNWSARLKEGRWFSKDDTKSNTLNIIIGGNTNGYKKGDEFTISGTNYSAKIIGILQADADIFCMSEYNASQFNYSSFFQQPYIENDGMYAICQQEVAEQKGLSVWNDLYYAYVYKDGISEEQSVKNHSTIFKNEMTGDSLENFMNKSKVVYRQKILSYLPTVVVVVLMVLISIYCISYIKIQKSNRVYSIYYLSGSSEKSLYTIVVGYTFMMILVSAGLYILLGNWFNYYAKMHNILFSFKTSSIVLPLILYVILGVFMSVCLIMEIRGKSAIEMVKKTVEA